MQLEIKKLGDVCDFYNGKAHEKAISESGEIKVVNSKFVSSEGVKYKLTEQVIFPLFIDDICLVMSDVPNGKTLAKCFLVDADNTYSLNQRICAIRTNQFDVKFLFYQLNRHPFLLGFNNGENQTNLRKDDILNCPLWMPSIPEQKRIVELLDTVFADLEQTRAKTEQNLKNARELFDSYLHQVFSQKGEGWVEDVFDNILEIRSGRNQKAVIDPNGKYPIYGSAGKVMDWANSYICEANTTIVGRKGTINSPMYMTTKFWNVDTAFGLIAGKKLDNKFLYYFCKSFDFSKLDKGTTLPSLVKKDLIKIMMPFPKLDEQKSLSKKLDRLSLEIKKVEAIYNEKLNSIDELKKTILQKAFSGELTATAE